MNKILFVSQNILDKKLGASKALMEICEQFKNFGWQADIIGPDEVKDYLATNDLRSKNSYAEDLITYLEKEAGKYDIIDIDQKVFPTNRGELSHNTIFIIRSALFFLHFTYIKIEKSRKLKHVINRIRKNIVSEINLLRHNNQLRRSIYEDKYENADFINVLNSRDKKALELLGINPEKIYIFPTGIDKERRKKFDEIAQEERVKNNIAFVGTFDYRKGCLDIGRIFNYIKSQISDAKLTVLGAQGLFSTKKEVLDFFPKNIQSSIEVTMRYQPGDLPVLLKEQTVGIFPSYIEGFPFSPTEKMAAGVPVFAYDAPGPCDGLQKEYLVKRGDWQEMANRVVDFLNNKKDWEEKRLAVWKHSQQYDWEEISKRTSDTYLEILQNK